MHPFLSAGTGAGDRRPDYSCTEKDGAIISRYESAETPRTPLVNALWEDAPDVVAMLVEMQWTAPALLAQTNLFTRPEADSGTEKLVLPFFHLLTPETASTTHYFWAAGRNMKVGDDAISQALSGGIVATFSGEDEPMIADIQTYLGSDDLLERRPLLLSVDKSAVLARRKLDKLIEAEAI